MTDTRKDLVEAIERADFLTSGEADAFIAFLSVVGPVGGSYDAAVTLFHEHYVGLFDNRGNFVGQWFAERMEDLTPLMQEAFSRSNGYLYGALFSSPLGLYWDVPSVRRDGPKGVFVFKRFSKELSAELLESNAIAADPEAGS